jgi:hypothetical protein
MLWFLLLTIAEDGDSVEGLPHQHCHCLLSSVLFSFNSPFSPQFLFLFSPCLFSGFFVVYRDESNGKSNTPLCVVFVWLVLSLGFLLCVLSFFCFSGFFALFFLLLFCPFFSVRGLFFFFSLLCFFKKKQRSESLFFL